MTNEQVKILAREAEREGQSNLAIILHVYLGSKAVKQDGLFAEHCQDFARSGLDWIKTEKRIEEIRNRRNN
jgi:hypothetical protein